MYIDEATRLMNEWLPHSPIKGICFKAIMLMPNLLTQKLSRNSKSKEHLLAFEQSLEVCKKREIKDLFLEGETTQVPLKNIKETILYT